MLLAEENIQLVAVAIPIVAIAGGILCAIVGMIMGTIRRTVETRAREESRREIAAYVAEGSISPEDATRLLEAGKKAKPGCDFILKA